MIDREPYETYDDSYEDWLALTMATAPLPKPDEESDSEAFYENAF